MKSLRILTFLIMVFSVIPLLSQVDEDEENYYDEPTIYDKKGFFVGLNLGYQFTNSDPASFYNGTAPNDMTIYLNNDLIRNRIIEELGGYNFALVEYADNMQYKPTFVLGLNLRYHFNRSSALVSDFNYTTLVASDVFVLDVDRPNNTGQTQENYESFDIWGKEQRLSICLGYQQGSYKPAAISGYWELGGVFTTVKIEQNKFRIGTLEYNILQAQYVSGNNYTFNKQPNVTSVGPYGQFGLLFSFDQVFMDIGYRMSWEKFEFEAEPKRKLNHLIQFRFIYNWGKSNLTDEL